MEHLGCSVVSRVLYSSASAWDRCILHVAVGGRLACLLDSEVCIASRHAKEVVKILFELLQRHWCTIWKVPRQLAIRRPAHDGKGGPYRRLSREERLHTGPSQGGKNTRWYTHWSTGLPVVPGLEDSLSGVLRGYSYAGQPL